MTQFTRVNGDFLPVAVYDANSQNGYTNSGNIEAVSNGNVVQPQGPQLQFFTIAGGGNCVIANATLQVIQAVEQLSTVMIYSANAAADTGNGAITIATYPASAWSAATLKAAVTAAVLPSTGNVANTYSVTVTAGATFPN